MGGAAAAGGARMSGLVGWAALLVALPVAVYGAVALVVGARRGCTGLVESGRNAAISLFFLASVAVAALEYALITRDFSVGYVAQVGSRSTPLFITVTSLWAALEGSLVFWLWVLALYTGVVAFLYRRRIWREVPYALAVLLATAVFFLIVLLGPGNPFERVSPVPADGPGPNPLLQNQPALMAFHPPTQYLGYVGFSVPYAFAVAALVTGRVDAWWVKAMRRWSLVAWTFLTLTIVAGGWWAYEVLGWGGYWAWDPVENADLMPWLTGTAFLHSVMVQERREMLRGWNVSLIVATFALTILGTFLTRSGVLGSVHAFTESLIGPLFLVFLGVVLLFSVALLLWRGHRLRRPGSMDSLLSREAAFLAANVVFVVLAFTVLLGTVFPLVAEAVRGVKVSVGAPFFNSMTVPLFALVIFLMGVGPALPWRRTSPRGLAARFVVPAGAGAAAALVGAALGARGFWVLLVFGLSGFAAAVMAREVMQGVGVGVSRGFGPGRALFRLVSANPRRYGGYIVHVGVLIAAVAVTVSWTSKKELEATVEPGGAVAVGNYVIRLEGLRAEEEPHRFAVISTLVVTRGAKLVGRLEPRLNYYHTQQQPVPTPSVRTTAREDLFLNLMAFENDGSSATIRAVVTPLVAWLWVGGYTMLAGVAVALWPGVRRSRKPLPVESAPEAQPVAEHPPEEEAVPV